MREQGHETISGQPKSRALVERLEGTAKYFLHLLGEIKEQIQFFSICNLFKGLQQYFQSFMAGNSPTNEP